MDMKNHKVLANRTIDLCDFDDYVNGNIFFKSLLNHLLDNLKFLMKCPFKKVGIYWESNVLFMSYGTIIKFKYYKAIDKENHSVLNRSVFFKLHYLNFEHSDSFKTMLFAAFYSTFQFF